MVSPEKKRDISLFKDLSFFIIGKTSQPSYQLADDIKRNGGQVVYSLSSKVSYVLTLKIDSSIPSSKLDQINDLKLIILQDSIIKNSILNNQFIKDLSTFKLSIDNINNNIKKDQDQTLTTFQIDSSIGYISGISIYSDIDKKQPYFSNHYEIITSNLLQCSSFISNNNINKFFYLEFQKGKDENNNSKFRIYSQFGRTNEIKQSTKQHRYFYEYDEGVKVYSSIYNNKVSEENGYKPVSVSYSMIGSPLKIEQTNKSNDNVDLVAFVDEDVERVKQRSYVGKEVGELINNLFKESTKSIISNFAVKITDRGIETPLGVLSSKQVEKGRSILEQLYSLVLDQCNEEDDPATEDTIAKLSSEFYSCIPTKIGQTAKDKKAAQLSTLQDISRMMENVELMNDMALVGEQNTRDLVSNTTVDMRYSALNATIHHCHPSSSDYGIVQRLLDSKDESWEKLAKIVNIYRVSKEKEEINFQDNIGNVRLLYHGTSAQNVLGILSRGLLMPQVVISKGGRRSDFGHLGSGIYFGDQLGQSFKFARSSKSTTCYIFVCSVALGDPSKQYEINSQLVSPPQPFNSCHGIKSTTSLSTSFPQDEFVIYHSNQQKLSYLIEFSI